MAAALAAGCGRLEFMAANAPAVFGSYRRYPNISYGADPQHRLDVYVPDQVSAAPRPVMVFWHGGRWSFGDKADYRFIGAALTELGYVTVLPNYRHYNQVKMAGFMDDAARASLWAAALRACGAPVTLNLYPNLGHADTVAALSLPARGRAPTLADIAAFVRRPPSL